MNIDFNMLIMYSFVPLIVSFFGNVNFQIIVIALLSHTSPSVAFSHTSIFVN